MWGENRRKHHDRRVLTTAWDGDGGVVGGTERHNIGCTGKDALSATLSEAAAKMTRYSE
jgi:hypothetical protein